MAKAAQEVQSVGLMAGGGGGGGELPRLGRAASELAPLLPDLAPGLSYMTETFTRAFIERVFQRLSGIGPGGGGDLPSFRGDSFTGALGFMAPPPPRGGSSGGGHGARPAQAQLPIKSWGRQ